MHHILFTLENRKLRSAVSAAILPSIRIESCGIELWTNLNLGDSNVLGTIGVTRVRNWNLCVTLFDCSVTTLASDFLAQPL